MVYGIDNETYFSLFQPTSSEVGVPVQCCLRIFSGRECLRFPLSPVYSQLNFILKASVPTFGISCPSIFSRTVTLAWSGPLCLVLKTHRTLIIDLLTSITIPFFHRLRLSHFLRKRGNNGVVGLVCTQSGHIEQLSAPIKYMVQVGVRFNIV